MSEKRNTETERRAVDSLVQRQVEQAKKNGAPVPDERGARERAVRIAEKSDAQRRDGGRR